MITKDEINGPVRTIEAEGADDWHVSLKRQRWDAGESVSGRQETDYQLAITQGGVTADVLTPVGVAVLTEALAALGLCERRAA